MTTTYLSALTVFLFWRGSEAEWPDLAKTVIICLQMLLSLLNFTWWALVWEKLSRTEDCCLVSGSYWYTLTRDDVLDTLWPAFVKPRSTLRASLSGTFLQGRKDVVNQCLEFGLEAIPLLCFSVSWWAQRFRTPRWWRRIQSKLPMKGSDCLRLISAIRGSSLIRRFTLDTSWFGSNGHSRSATTLLSSLKRRSATLKVLVPVENCNTLYTRVPGQIKRKGGGAGPSS